MAQIVLTIPDNQVARVLVAFREVTGNPAFGAAELKTYLAGNVKAVVKQAETITAIDAATVQVAASVEAISIT